MKLQHCHVCHCVVVARTDGRSALCAECAFKTPRSTRDAILASPAGHTFEMPYAAAVAKYPAPTRV